MNRIVKGLALLVMCALLPTMTWGATLNGRVTFTGKVKKGKRIKMGKDRNCLDYYQGKPPPRSESLVVGDEGAVQWAFVYIMEKVKSKGRKAPCA